MNAIHNSSVGNTHPKTAWAWAACNRRGTMIVLVAMMLVMLLMTVTFSIDVAYMQLTRTELRAATDAAARAAAEALSRQQSTRAAQRAAKQVARRNLVGGQPLLLRNSEIVPGRSEFSTTGIWKFTPGGTPPNAIKVYGKRTTGSRSGAVPLFFGGIFGFAEFEPEHEAVASQLDRDVALVVDHSGSMNSNGRWDGLIAAIDVFMTEIDRTPQREVVSLSGYSTNAARIQPLTDDSFLITQALGQLSPGGWTNIGGGLLVGSDSLAEDAERRVLAAKTIVLLTDGNHNIGTDPLVAAQTALSRGHVVHTITFGSGANSTLMEQVAALTGGRYYHAADNAQLLQVFREIALTLPVVLSQ